MYREADFLETIAQNVNAANKTSLADGWNVGLTIG
jgi:hypothetical protein